MGLHRQLSGKESACNAQDARDAGLIPGLGKSSRGRHDNLLQYSCLENPTDSGALWATVSGIGESDTTEVTKYACTHHNTYVCVYIYTFICMQKYV